jgi:predicted nucleic acid-binding protein
MATPALHRAYGSPPLSNRDARASLEILLAHPRILIADEPAGVSELWLQLADHQRPAPKLWMDAYLAAVAIQGGWRLLSLDQDFERFCSAGLQLTPLR